MNERENLRPGETLPRSRTQTGEISNDELDRDAMQRADERAHGTESGEASRSDLGAGE